jgi:hypothetical protein
LPPEALKNLTRPVKNILLFPKKSVRVPKEVEFFHKPDNLIMIIQKRALSLFNRQMTFAQISFSYFDLLKKSPLFSFFDRVLPAASLVDPIGWLYL